MFGRLAGAVADTFKSDPRKVYADVAFKELEHPTSGKPAAVRVLRELLNTYFTEGKFSSNLRSHSELANSCVKILDESDSPTAAIQTVITKLNNIKEIKAGRHFATLLNIYFSAFQEHLPSCNEKVVNAAIDGNTWLELRSQHINGFVRTFIQNYTVGEELQHVRLAEVAAILPEELADEYCKFLVEEIRSSRRKEELPGMHDGYAFLALGEIFTKSNAESRAVIIEELTKGVHQSETTSIIGAGYALAHLEYHLDKKTYKKAADQLYLYALQELQHLSTQFNDEQQTQKIAFISRLFAALNKFSRQYTQEQKDSITNILQKNTKTSHALRDGMATLQAWFPAHQKSSFMDLVPKTGELNDTKKLELCSTLGTWVQASNFESAWSPFNPMRSETLRQLKSGLTAYNLMSIETHARFALLSITSTNPATIQDRKDIISHICRLISKNLIHKLDDNSLSKVYRTLAILAPWIKNDAQLSGQIVGRLYECSTSIGGLASQIHAAHTTLLFADHLDTDQIFKLRDILLSGLDNEDCAASAKEMLTEYINAASTPCEDLPSLMSCTMVKPYYEARLLLCEAETKYTHELQKAYENQNRLVAGM